MLPANKYFKNSEKGATVMKNRLEFSDESKELLNKNISQLSRNIIYKNNKEIITKIISIPFNVDLKIKEDLVKERYKLLNILDTNNIKDIYSIGFINSVVSFLNRLYYFISQDMYLNDAKFFEAFLSKYELYKSLYNSLMFRFNFNDDIFSSVLRIVFEHSYKLYDKYGFRIFNESVDKFIKKLNKSNGIYDIVLYAFMFPYIALREDICEEYLIGIGKFKSLNIFDSIVNVYVKYKNISKEKFVNDFIEDCVSNTNKSVNILRLFLNSSFSLGGNNAYFFGNVMNEYNLALPIILILYIIRRERGTDVDHLISDFINHISHTTHYLNHAFFENSDPDIIDKFFDLVCSMNINDNDKLLLRNNITCITFYRFLNYSLLFNKHCFVNNREETIECRYKSIEILIKNIIERDNVPISFIKYLLLHYRIVDTYAYLEENKVLSNMDFFRNFYKHIKDYVPIIFKMLNKKEILALFENNEYWNDVEHISCENINYIEVLADAMSNKNDKRYSDYIYSNNFNLLNFIIYYYLPYETVLKSSNVDFMLLDKFLNIHLLTNSSANRFIKLCRSAIC